MIRAPAEAAKNIKNVMGSKMDKNILKFLIKARQSTYASGMKPTIINSANTYVIKDNDLEYRDIYFDQRQYFQGQEVIFQNDNPIWSMSYRGAATKDAEPDEVFDVLQRFIKEYADKVRFGEDFEKEENEFKYICRGEGSLDEFKGREEVYQNNKLAHWMEYFGGEIK